MANQDQCIAVCNRLLRGELSAVQTYDQAILKFEGQPQASTLQDIRNDHQESVLTLEEHLLSMDAKPDADSGIWGGFVQALEGAATLMGESPALQLLKQGEEHGIEEYRDALADDGVMEEIKVDIRSRLLPALEAHLNSLDSLRQ